MDWDLKGLGTERAGRCSRGGRSLVRTDNDVGGCSLCAQLSAKPWGYSSKPHRPGLRSCGTYLALPREPVGVAFIFQQLQGDLLFLLKGKGNRLDSSLDTDISEMCARHRQTPTRSPSFWNGGCSKPACIAFHCASRIYFIVYETCGGEGRRTGAPESLRTSQGV